MSTAARIVGLLSVVLALTLSPKSVFASAGEETAPTEETSSATLGDSLNDALAEFNSWIGGALFFSVTGDIFNQPLVDDGGQPVLDEHGNQKERAVGFPFIVFILAAGGVFFTFFYRFIAMRGLQHAVDIVRGKYDRPEDEGDVSHFRALTSALSATVGLGNIAGVAIAIQVGGPGAILWMICAAFFGMSLKFNSCTLSQMFRKKNLDGTVSGGPMYYLDLGLQKVGGPGSPVAMFGKALAFIYALMVMGGSFGGGNMFQANQSYRALEASFDISSEPWFDIAGTAFGAADVVGVVLATLVALVIIGGIQRIGAATSRIVPAMVAIYVVASLFIIVVNIAEVPASLALIFRMAFTDNAAFGGIVGVLVMGVQRASFSNEAGIGSAAIAHAAAKTDQPVREGLVAMLEPVIDTMMVCLMTALVVVITGAWNDEALKAVDGDLKGVQLTAAAFGKEISWFPAVLTVSVLLFAYSTMISWAYYGERGWIYILDHFGEGAGHRTLIIYRSVFVFFVYMGAVAKLGEVLAFSDYMILCMALPNIVGGAVLSPTVRNSLTAYWRRFRAGDFTQRGAPTPGTPEGS